MKLIVKPHKKESNEKDKKCAFCGKEFTCKSGSQRYCSEHCAEAAKTQRKKRQQDFLKAVQPVIDLASQEYLTFSKAAILASHKRKPNKSSWQTDPIVEPSKKVNVANATTSKPKVIAETAMTSLTADAANETDISNEHEDSNESNQTKAYSSIVASNDFNAIDVTSSFDQLKIIYKKVGNNESQAFGVWQQLSESERTAAFAHTQRLQGDLSLRSYLYVYLREKEWMKAM